MPEDTPSELLKQGWGSTTYEGKFEDGVLVLRLPTNCSGDERRAVVVSRVIRAAIDALIDAENLSQEAVNLAFSELMATNMQRLPNPTNNHA